jgi:hypothetical protein
MMIKTFSLEPLFALEAEILVVTPTRIELVYTP